MWGTRTRRVDYGTGVYSASLGEFAMGEAERSYSYLDTGLGGLPEHKGISQRFEMFAGAREQSDGIRFLRAAVSFVKDRLGLDQDAFLLREG